MSSTATQRLRLDKQATGDNPNAWGVRLNAALDLIDESQGLTVVAVNANAVLTSNNYSSDQSRRMVLKLTGAGGFSVTIPQVEKAYFIHNACPVPVTIKTALDAGIAVRPNVFRWVYCDGSAVNGDVTIEAGEAADAARLAATQAAASAAAAATFDPANFYTKTVSDARFAPAGLYPNLDDFRTLAIQLAKVKGATVGMAAGVADDFRDLSGLASMTAATDDLASMISNSAPSGQTATATTQLSPAYYAFDGVGSTAWSSNGAFPQSLQRTSTAPRREAAYAITGPSTVIEAPISWTRWGSNDGGTTKTTIDTRTNVPAWTVGERRIYYVPPGSRTNYTTYGITITQNGGSGSVTIPALESLLEGESANCYIDTALNTVNNGDPGASVGAPMDARSVVFQALAVPTKASLLLLVKAAFGTITPNTNFIAKLSRDGGATYTTVTLASTGTFSSGFTVYEANGFDISGQPSGSSMKWRLQTTGTTLIVQVDAIVVQWG